jgi:signal transduction histidine kinase
VVARSRQRTGLVALLIAVVVFVILAAPSVINEWAGRPFQQVVFFFPSVFLRWLVWLPLIPAVRWVHRRCRDRTLDPLGTFLFHLPAAVVICLLPVPLWMLAMPPYDLAQPFGSLSHLVVIWSANYSYDFVIYWALIGFFHVLDSKEARLRGELREARLETELVRARLSELNRHLNPHMLFNTLNVVSHALRTDDRQRGLRVVQDLADLLRRGMERVDAEWVTAREELEFAEAYARLQKERRPFGFSVSVDPPEVLDREVPAFVIQPLVENAIKYGVGEEDGEIRVAVQGGTDLVITVTNPVQPGPEREGVGLGLSALAARLDLLYGGRASLSHQVEEPLARTVIRLPGRPAGDRRPGVFGRRRRRRLSHTARARPRPPPFSSAP